MKKYQFRTRKKPVKVVIPLKSEGPAELFIAGYDPASPKTEYFFRKININGEDLVEFNCPQSPNILKVIIWSSGNGKFTVPGIKLAQADPTPFTKSNKSPDIKLIESFARRAGRLNPRRTYVGKKANFKIQYLPVIRKDNGDPHPTPARIHVSAPIIQVSKRAFDKMTVPARIAILLHEYAHNFLNYNQDNEMEADANAMDLYLQLGYPRIEGVYAFANIMTDTDVNYQRVSNIIRELS